jgi:hypothetical protein
MVARLTDIEPGKYLGRKRILEVVKLSSGWILVKTENKKSLSDFLVKTITDKRKFTPKHAHFLIDFYGKLCQDKENARRIFEAIIRLWEREGPVQKILTETLLLLKNPENIAGYDLEYILHALKWILEQEDINFTGRPPKLQQELDEKLQKAGITVPPGREGSQLAIGMFCDVLNGIHPVEALIRAGLDIVPVRKKMKRS